MSQSGHIPMNLRTHGLYKSKLRQLCQRRLWPPPEYTTLRQGLPHDPVFKATVLVNGLLFHTSDFFKRANNAQIEAAKVALDHFTAPRPAAPGASGISFNMNKRRINNEISTPFTEEQVQASEKSSDTKRHKQSGELHMYKNQLQTFVRKKGYSLPVYTFEQEGPPHISRFKSKVTIDGHTYESIEYFPTLKESEHAAAKVAWMSIVPPESQDFGLDKSIFKNLLQEFSQKSGLEMPVYNTVIISGANRMPSFVSTVIVGGGTFIGVEAKTKKHSEMNAAEVAYTCLRQSENLGPSGSAPACSSKGVSASNVNAISDLRETNQLGVSSNLISSQNVTGLPKGGNQEAPKQLPCAGIGSKDSFGSPNLKATTTASPATHADPRDVVCVNPRAMKLEVPSGAVTQHCDGKLVAFEFRAN